MGDAADDAERRAQQEIEDGDAYWRRAMPDPTYTGQVGHSSAGVSYLTVEKRTELTALNYKIESVASYELFYKDGEVALVKHSANPDTASEIVYSEILEES